jgi:GT2 family glycosyltransferase
MLKARGENAEHFLRHKSSLGVSEASRQAPEVRALPNRIGFDGNLESSNFIARGPANMTTLHVVNASDSTFLPPGQQRFDRRGHISVIIPVWRNTDEVIPLVQRLKSFPEVREIIVPAAEPLASLRERLKVLGAIFVESSRPNRGLQSNRGAQVAMADWLLFHHADTELTAAHVAALAALDSAEIVGGAFYRKFDERHPRLRFLEKFERWHSRAFGTLYGDQSIFVRREHFLSMGGFAPFPLMEDVEFSARLRRSGKIKLLDPPMRSCARMQIARGAWKTTLRNLLFLVLFRCGVSAERLHAWYYALDRRSAEQQPGPVLPDPIQPAGKV